MNQDDTIALFDRCNAARAQTQAKALAEGKNVVDAHAVAQAAAKAVWNCWAEEMLAERKALEASGRWSAERNAFGVVEPRNEETRNWMEAAQADFANASFVRPVSPNEVRFDLGDIKSQPAAWKSSASITVEDEEIDLSGFIFPGMTNFEEAQFLATTRFGGAQFSGETRFRDAKFFREAWFDRVQFLAEAQFQEVQLLSRSWFKGAQFCGAADFDKARFAGETWFDEVLFCDRTRFGAARFTSETRFHKARFSGDIGFQNAQFSSMAWFDKAQFAGEARFDEAEFSANAWFHEVEFSGEANFRSAKIFIADFQKVRFAGAAHFDQTQFSGETDFKSAQFCGDASFSKAQFSGNVDFGNARFAQNVSFVGAEFARHAVFTQAGFDSDAFFSNARFRDTANFRLAAFPGFATFEGAHFQAPSNFNAILCGRAFDLNSAAFDHVPDFIQAHFQETPRLDNLSVRARMVLGAQAFGDGRFWHSRWSYPIRATFGVIHRIIRADRDIPARWRSLRRLAAVARDHDREREFFAQEVRSGRFAWDWPLPWPVWKTRVWLGFFRFWLGLAYGLTSNYGRAVGLPLLWWLGAVGIGAIFYLGEHEGIRQRRAAVEASGAHWITAYLSTSGEAWRVHESCYVPGEDRPSLGALSPAIRAATSAPKAAFELALRTGLVVLDPGPDNARRIYGCLYGVERFGESVAPVVPSSVSYFMIAQKVFCALMILLFGLALRNMLSMR